ncbi:MAG TPA: Asp-tRNA(Asn)/Glu-tRNA(Gln) amidotransferase subunit GatB [Phycisphaerae bacterium]|nr:Asp-tRNA(Asn)/Glu-tRNA(Gln) amidotransferase subunit GatB [Phycisphaerae bacterium]
MSAKRLVPTIGLEVHLHLATRTKMFCGCRVEYGAPPNSRVCPVCLGMPGVLPVMNEKAVELAVRMALALGCTIPALAKWDRKHYYYPDLPKNYQISEYDEPLGVGGYLEIPVEGGTKRIGITRVHLEEDAGKLMHAEGGGNFSVVDLNRTGTPLLEIVSEPDMNSPEEVRAYSTALRQLAVYLGVGECNMQLGQMRFEPNISLRIGTGADGRPRYTPIAEIKNLNSFRSTERAVAFEIARHKEEYALDPEGYTLENLGKQTRGWVDDQEVTFLQRSKEEAHDYRYFPEPDLVPVRPHEPRGDRASVAEVAKQKMPELPEAKRRRYMQQGMSAEMAEVILRERGVAESWEKIVQHIKTQPEAGRWDGKRVMDLAHNWILQDVRRVLNERGIAIEALALDTYYSEEELAKLIILVETGVISRSMGSDVFTKMLESGKSASEIVEEENLAQTSDAGELEAVVDRVIAENPGPAEDYRSGKEKALGRLIGQAMQASSGKANPKIVRDLLMRKLRP